MIVVMSAVLEGTLRDLTAWKPDGCSIVKALDIVGTRSAILILREAMYGTTRFDGFAARIGITDAAAAAALRKLTAAGLLAKRPYREEGKRTRHEYVLTEMGRDLLPVVVGLWQWGTNTFRAGCRRWNAWRTRRVSPCTWNFAALREVRSGWRACACG